MKLNLALKLFIYFTFLFGTTLQSVAQTNDASHIKSFSIQYSGIYQMQDSYTIIYDNTAETAPRQDARNGTNIPARTIGGHEAPPK